MQPYGADPVAAFDGHWLAIEQKFDAFLARVFHLTATAGHVVLIAAIGAHNPLGALADRCAYAVHGGVAATQYQHALILEIDIWRVLISTVQHMIHVANQVRQCRVHAGQIKTGKVAADILVGTDAGEHGVVVVQQRGQRDITPDLGIQMKTDVHVVHDLVAGRYHLLVQFEWRNTVGEQAADAGIAIKYLCLDAGAGKHVGAGQSGRSGADDGDALAGGHHLAQIRSPALLDGFIGDVLLDRADAHRTEAVIQRAGTFTQPILWTDAATDLRQ